MSKEEIPNNGGEGQPQPDVFLSAEIEKIKRTLNVPEEEKALLERMLGELKNLEKVTEVKNVLKEDLQELANYFDSPEIGEVKNSIEDFLLKLNRLLEKGQKIILDLGLEKVAPKVLAAKTEGEATRESESANEEDFTFAGQNFKKERVYTVRDKEKDFSKKVIIKGINDEGKLIAQETETNKIVGLSEADFSKYDFTIFDALKEKPKKASEEETDNPITPEIGIEAGAVPQEPIGEEETTEVEAPAELPPDFLVEIIGSQNLKDIFTLFVKDGNEAQIKEKLAQLFDRKFGASEKESLAGRLKVFGFESFDAFQEKWKAEMHERVLAGLQEIRKFQIEQIIAKMGQSEAQISAEEKPKGFFRRKADALGSKLKGLGKAMWQAAPAGVVGVAMSVVLLKATASATIAAGAAGGAMKLTSRFTRGRRGQKLIKEGMAERADKEGDLLISAAVSAALQEQPAEKAEADELANLRFSKDVLALVMQAVEKKIETQATQENIEWATDKRLERSLATLKLKNVEKRQEKKETDKLLDNIKNKPIMGKIMSAIEDLASEMKKKGTTRDLWLYDESWKKRVAGAVLEAMAGSITGAVLVGSTVASPLITKLGVRGGIGFLAGGVESLARDVSHEEEMSEQEIDEFLSGLQSQNEIYINHLRQKFSQKFGKEKTSLFDKLLSASKTGVKRGALIIGLGAGFDFLRHLVQDELAPAPSASEKVAPALAGAGHIDEYVQSAPAENVMPSLEEFQKMDPTEMKDFLSKNLDYDPLVHKGQGITSVMMRDFQAHPEHLQSYAEKIPGLQKLFDANKGDISNFDESELKLAASYVYNHDFKGLGELRVDEADKLAVIFKDGRYDLSSLDDKSAGEHLYNYIKPREEVVIDESVGAGVAPEKPINFIIDAKDQSGSDLSLIRRGDVPGASEYGFYLHPSDEASTVSGGGVRAYLENGKFFGVYKGDTDIGPTFHYPSAGELKDTYVYDDLEMPVKEGIIDGVVYDAKTGLPISEPAIDLATQEIPAQKIPFKGDLPVGAELDREDLTNFFRDKVSVPSQVAEDLKEINPDPVAPNASLEQSQPGLEEDQTIKEPEKLPQSETETVDTLSYKEAFADFMTNKIEPAMRHLGGIVKFEGQAGFDADSEASTKELLQGLYDKVKNYLLLNKDEDFMKALSSVKSSGEISDLIEKDLFAKLTPDEKVLLSTEIPQDGAVATGAHTVKLIDLNSGKSYFFHNKNFEFSKDESGSLLARGVGGEVKGVENLVKYKFVAGKPEVTFESLNL